MTEQEEKELLKNVKDIKDNALGFFTFLLIFVTFLTVISLPNENDIKQIVAEELAQDLDKP